MAVIMANLMEYNVASYRDTSPFTDVPSWAEPYVAACYTNGITSGYSDTIYGGEDSVTTAQAALMLMKALGYFQYASDFGQEWQLATLKQGNAIDLFIGVDSRAEDPLTRNDVAQLVLNTLKAGTVQASTSGSIEIGGVVINNNVQYNYITSNASYASAINNRRSTNNDGDLVSGPIVELGEQLYMGDLQLNDNETDVFGRPARYWEYEGSEIGTYAKTELLKQSYTTKVTGKDLYDLLGSNIVDHYNFNITIDGVTDYDIDNNIFDETSINRNNKAGVGATGNGVLTEVYVDTDEDVREVSIAIINTYLAIANDDYNERQDDVSLEVYGVQEISDEYVKTTGGDNHETLDVSGEDFDIADVAEDDLFLVNIAAGEIQIMGEPETMSAVEISSFKQGDSLTVDGADYDYASSAEYDHETLEAYTDGTIINLKDMTYNVYLDQYGYVIGVVEVEVPNNYLFITGINGNYDNLANVTYEANAIFLDGHMEKITIDAKKSDFKGNLASDVLSGTPDDATINRWFTYSVNSKDVYTVDLVDVGAGVNKLGQSTENRDGNAAGDVGIIDYKHDSTNDGAVIPARVYGNDYTVYLTASIEAIKTADDRYDVVIDDVDSVAVGIDNVDIRPWSDATVEGKYASLGTDLNKIENSHGIYTLYDEDGYIIAMVVVGEDNGASDSLVYVHSGSVSRESWDKTNEEWTWTRSVIMDGEETTLTEVDDTRISMLQDMEENKWYRVRFNANGEVNSVRAEQTATIDKDLDFEDWELNAGSYRYVYDHDAAVPGGNDAINYAINELGVDTVLYHEGFVYDIPTCNGKTLYMTQADDSYIRFTDETKVVFEQENNNEWTTEFWTGESGVKRAIRELHDVASTPAEDYRYTISAVIDDGRASVIIIRDDEGHGVDGTAPSTNSNYEISQNGSDFSLLYRVGTFTPGTDDELTVVDMIEARLAQNGYSEFVSSKSGNQWTIRATKNNKTMEFTWDVVDTAGIDDGVLVKIDGKSHLVKVDDALDTIIKNATYAKRTRTDDTVTYANTDTAVFNAIDDGATYETGYYRVTVTGGSYSLDEDYNTSDDNIIFMKPGETVQITISNKDWTLVEPIDSGSTGFTFANCKAIGTIGCTVDMTAPSTMNTNITVTISYQARS